MRDNELGDATGGAEETGNEPANSTQKPERPRRASRPAGPPPEPVEDTAQNGQEQTGAPPDDADRLAAETPAPNDAETPARKSLDASPAAGTPAREDVPPDADVPARKEPDVRPAAEIPARKDVPSDAETPGRKDVPSDAEARVRKDVPPDAEAPARKEPDARPAAGTPAKDGSDVPGETADVPEVPARNGAARSASAAEAVPPGAEAAFQPPMVVFQPPELPAEAVRPKAKPVAEAKAKPAAEAKAESKPEEPDDEQDGDEDAPAAGRRRRRRGGRGRGKAKDAQETEETDKTETEEQAAGESAEEEDESAATRRRRRRRRRAAGADGEDIAPDDPPNTVVHVREPRAAEDEVQSVKGSTRLEAKKQRRREGREQGRRRPPIVTESEFLARRESVERVMVIRSEGERTQIGVLEDNILVEHYVDRSSHQSYVGNVYLGKVQNVLPSMEAAFVDIGKGRNAVLYAGEVNWDIAGLEGQPRRIESALKSGQSVLVQVTKDPLGHKGARLTSQISLPGRYLVYVPDGSMTGISRKLPDKERTRLKQILKKVMPENAGVIVRTAAEGAAEEELSRDVSRLAAQWDNIKRQSKTSNAPAMLYGEPDLTIRVVRDIFNEDFARLVVQGDDAWDMVEEYVGYVAPHLADRLKKWTGPDDVFTAYRVDEQIAKALERKVWLPSGGSLVIDRTEAMTVIDVNTGKFTGQGGNLEETVTRNNLEAAEELVHQLRLRDIGGIIVIDFIDMVLESNRELVLRRMLECLARDRTKHQVAEVTSLGLVQMTRKRVGGGLLESFSEPCESCNGRGVHVTLSPVELKQDKGGPSRRRKRKGDVERTVEAKIARAAERDKAVEVVVEDEAHEEYDAEPSANGRRRRSRRSTRAKTEATAE